jgi:hypothetical protein
MDSIAAPHPEKSKQWGNGRVQDGVVGVLRTFGCDHGRLYLRRGIFSRTANARLRLKAIRSHGAWTGGEARHALGNLPATMAQLVHDHAEWGETTRNLAIAAAVLAVVGLWIKGSPRIARAFRFIVLIVAVITTVRVIQTGRLGGEMDYHHAVDISQDATPK